MKKILIVKTSAFGDIVHTYPVVSYLKGTYPEAQIDWVVESASADLVRSHPDVSNAIIVDTKQWRRAPFSSETREGIRAFRRSVRQCIYDVVFDLQGNTKSGLLLSQTKAHVKVGFGRGTVSEWPNMLFTSHRLDLPKGENIRSDYLTLVGSYLGCANPSYKSSVELLISDAQRLQLLQIISMPRIAGKTKIMVCPGSAWKNKQMDKPALISLLKKVGARLNAAFLFAWGSPEEKTFAEDLSQYFPDHSIVLEKMPLPLLQNLMNHTSLVIAMDSLPLHLAGTTSAATMSVFGPSSSQKYRPLGKKHFAFQGACPYGRTFEKRCPILRTCSTGACIRDLTGSEVFEAFNQWWNAFERETVFHDHLISTL